MSRSDPNQEFPIVTAHAAMRWSERMPSATVDVGTAWRTGIPVEAPKCDCDSATLYPPEDALFLRKNDRIVTVLPADYTRLDMEKFVWCMNCNCVTTLKRSWDRCEWCSHKTKTEQLDGKVMVRS